MGLVLQLVETRADGGTRSVELMELGRPGNLRDIADSGLTLPEAKQLLTCVQQAVVAVQARDHAMLRPDCARCGERFRIKDWRSRRVATLFGEMVVRLPRLRCPGCGRGVPLRWLTAGEPWPTSLRSGKRPKICCTKDRCAGMSPLGTARTCPLASIAIASMPASVRFAVQKP